jgi:4-hydroxy-tetrahydrodipicolinate synthase
MSTEPSTGKLIPLVSPFTDDGSSLSEVRISRLIRRWSNAGAHGFFIGGDAGEFLCLSSGERKYLVEIVLRDSFSSLPVVVNISSLSTSKSLDLSQHAARHGARAAFLTPPYYGKYSDAEIGNHIRTVVNFSNIPVILADPDGVITPGVEQHLRDVPRLTRASIEGWDDWSSDEFSVSTLETLADILGEPSSLAMRVLLGQRGAAAVMKAAYERSGLDLGFPRSPRASVAGSDLSHLLEQAA